MDFAVKLILVLVIAVVLGTAVWWFVINKSQEEQTCDSSACPELKTGTLKGKVTIGPLCPVEPCPVTVPNPYISRTIILQKQAGDLSRQLLCKKTGSLKRKLAPALIY